MFSVVYSSVTNHDNFPFNSINFSGNIAVICDRLFGEKQWFFVEVIPYLDWLDRKLNLNFFLYFIF